MTSLFSRILFGKELTQKLETLKDRPAPKERGALKKHNRKLLEVQTLTRRALLFRAAAVAILGSGVAFGVGKGCEQNYDYGFDFTFDENFTPDEINRISTVIEVALPELKKYIPSQDKLGKTIDVRKVLQYMHRSTTSYGDGVLNIDSRGTDGLIVHELVHILHGNKDLYIDLIEEGLASAISILTTDAVGLGSWNSVEYVEMNKTLTDGGLALMSYVSSDSYPPLQPLRYYMWAKLWLDLEKAKPGFIREFHEAYYDYLDKGGTKNALYGDAFLGIVRDIDAELFDSVATENPSMRFLRTDTPERKLLYIHYVHLKNDKRGLMLNLVNKDKDGAEKGIHGKEVKVKFINVNTGASYDVSFSTQQYGEVNILLNEPLSNGVILEDTVGHSDRYRIIAEVDGVKEEFEFSYL